MALSGTCPPDADLHRHVQGHLPPAQATAVSDHLAGCARCRHFVANLQSEGTIGESGATPDPGVEPTAAFAVGGGTSDYSLKPDRTYEFLAPPQVPEEIGRLAHYRVRRLLGEGGMGLVFEAEDLHLERTVALKVMKPALAANPLYKDRFQREARAAAALRDDHVVTIFQVGEENGLPFLAMEYLQGVSMEQLLARGSRLSLVQVLRLGRQAALGLAAAHEKGLVHRDIKPANLWIEPTAGGRVKILDFGLARPAVDNVQITQSGVVVGTPAYMSPEQARGLKVDQRSDLFSLGCVLYRLCTGRVPFQGDSAMAILTALAVDDPLPIREANPDIPETLAALVERLLAKKPEDRPENARLVALQLGALEKGPVEDRVPKATESWKELGSPALDSPAIPVEPLPRREAGGRRSWKRWLVTGALALALLFLLNDQRRRAPGTLVVEVGFPGLETTIRHNGKIIAERDLQREYVLPPGKGTVEVLDQGHHLLARSFEILPGEKQHLDLRQDLRDALGAMLKKKALPPPGKKNLSSNEWWARLRGTLAATGDALWNVELPPWPGAPLDPRWVRIASQKWYFDQLKEVDQELARRNPDYKPTLKTGLPAKSGGKVKYLELEGAEVLDITPLQIFTDLEVLKILVPAEKDGKLRDLRPLVGLKLKELHCRNSPIASFAPLANMPLENLSADLDPARDLDDLLKMKHLRMINGQPAPVVLAEMERARMKVGTAPPKK